MRLRRTQPANVLAQLALGRAAGALAAASLGAVALGAVAIGRLFVRKLSVRDVRSTRVSIDDLTVARLHIGEFVRDDVPPPPIR